MAIPQKEVAMRRNSRCSVCDSQYPRAISLQNPVPEHDCGRVCVDEEWEDLHWPVTARVCGGRDVTNRCENPDCSRPFELTRRSWHIQQFCSAECRESYKRQQ